MTRDNYLQRLKRSEARRRKDAIMVMGSLLEPSLPLAPWYLGGVGTFKEIFLSHWYFLPAKLAKNTSEKEKYRSAEGKIGISTT